ncbi:acid protease [Phlegmacium glaucopus]|nr:acid protease [Phlegmacium glaucopus]
MVPGTLLTTLLLALAVAANPIIVQRSLVTLPISRRINLTSISNLLQHDQARARALKATGEAKVATGGISAHSDVVISSPADNQAVSYIASVGVGSPATTYSLIIDTGSSNTWVGATKAYVKTSTSTQTPDSVWTSTETEKPAKNFNSDSPPGSPGPQNDHCQLAYVGYTEQWLEIPEYRLLQLSLPPPFKLSCTSRRIEDSLHHILILRLVTSLVIPKQSIGVAARSTGFAGVDGIIGIGPVDLTLGTLSPHTTATIPTVTDNLFAAGTITANEIGVSFEPITSPTGEQLNGELTWGGIDSSKFTGAITFTPITTVSPSKLFWGINQSIRYGTTTILSSTPGIVDTGTTLVLIATNALNSYKSLTGAVVDSRTGLLKITSTQFANLKTLSFVVSGVSFGLTPNGQLWPRNLNTLIGGTASSILLIVADIGTNSGSGLDFINGQTFLERFYAVFDTAGKRVGLATTSFTTATTN